MPTHREQDAQLDQLYDQVPRMLDCQGHCWFTCRDNIGVSPRERQRARERGVRIAGGRDTWCEALDGAGRCRIYPIRPAVCRAWGTAEGMGCPYGCTPEQWLTAVQVIEFIAATREAGGGAGGGFPTVAQIRQVLEKRPDMVGLVREFMAFSTGDADRARQLGTTLPAEITRRKRRT